MEYPQRSGRSSTDLRVLLGFCSRQPQNWATTGLAAVAAVMLSAPGAAACPGVPGCDRKSPTSSLRLVFDVAMWQALGHAQSVRNGSVA